MRQQTAIGRVKLNYLNKVASEQYSDGPVEDELLELFSHPKSDQKRRKLLNSSPSWALYYHLSPVRGAIVDWFDFKKGSTIIEIGAGCGAITEALVSKPVKVSALELTDKRAVINATRNQKAKNLEMLIGNLQELPEEAKFDYAVCVGVLEYAGTFIEGDQPYHKFLELIRRHLKPGGTLLLAIENRLGIKYWAGAREDHTGHLFDGLNAYPNKAVQTFGRLELEILFSESGYRSSDFHYPFPDYKHPHMIYSDSYYPGNGAEFPLGMLPTPVPGQDRVELFSEALAMLSIESNQLFPYFSNSFIVVAENEK